jgi:hypothetical protein
MEPVGVTPLRRKALRPSGYYLGDQVAMMKWLKN